MGSENVKKKKNHKELPNLSRLYLFPKVEREYRKGPVFGYLNEVFGQKWPLWHEPTECCVYIYI